MKKVLTNDLTLYFTSEFPKKFSTKVSRHRALLGIGGNVGNVPRRFKKLLQTLKNNPRIRVIQSTPILKNPPFGYVEQSDFFNSLLVIDTSLSPKALLYTLLYLEKRFKRKRTFKNAPRTLDIDIIFYDDIVMQSKDLTIPHPHWFERESVLIPLCLMEV